MSHGLNVTHLMLTSVLRQPKPSISSACYGSAANIRSGRWAIIQDAKAQSAIVLALTSTAAVAQRPPQVRIYGDWLGVVYGRIREWTRRGRDVLRSAR
jgi:hypothetical protein